MTKKNQKPQKFQKTSPQSKPSSESPATAKNNYDIDLQTCSTTDCTGLIPALPETKDQLEAYEDLYPYITHAKADNSTSN